MAFCRNCGQQIHDEAVICPHCGVPQARLPVQEGKPSVGWGFLGFFLPIVGLILFLVWGDSKPKTARLAGKGALISVIAGAAFWILYIVLVVVIFASMAM